MYLSIYLSIYVSLCNYLPIYLCIPMYLSIYLSIYLPMYPYVTIYLSIYPYVSIYLPIYVPLCNYLSVYLSMYPYVTIYLSICLPIYVSPSNYQSTSLSTYLSVYLSMYLHLTTYLPPYLPIYVYVSISIFHLSMRQGILFLGSGHHSTIYWMLVFWSHLSGVRTIIMVHNTIMLDGMSSFIHWWMFSNLSLRSIALSMPHITLLIGWMWAERRTCMVVAAIGLL